MLACLFCLRPVFGLRSIRLRPCTSQLMRRIEGLLVASHPILEKEGAVVFIVERSVVVGPVEDTAVHACVP